MPDSTLFLDDDHQIVPEHEATRMVVHTTDAAGETVREEWFTLQPVPREPVARPDRRFLTGVVVGVLAGVVIGWLVARR